MLCSRVVQAPELNPRYVAKNCSWRMLETILGSLTSSVSMSRYRLSLVSQPMPLGGPWANNLSNCSCSYCCHLREHHVLNHDTVVILLQEWQEVQTGRTLAYLGKNKDEQKT